ncbi:hypothetical protein V7S43_003932 [Phytophthora oleae]|uniref:PiggyBac transposable element-derived protein domain-containing protein n=2 Tax=Phytophthora oleae TaxID=2107226 RepID=A0ABD3G0L5_9STRA
MWWFPDDSMHLFKPLSEWTQVERSNAGITRSWYSVAKLLGEEFAVFAGVMGEPDKGRWKKDVFPVLQSYYALYYGGANGSGNDHTFTIAMIASFIRKDRRIRTNSACPAK